MLGILNIISLRAMQKEISMQVNVEDESKKTYDTDTIDNILNFLIWKQFMKIQQYILDNAALRRELKTKLNTLRESFNSNDIDKMLRIFTNMEMRIINILGAMAFAEHVNEFYEFKNTLQVLKMLKENNKKQMHLDR